MRIMIWLLPVFFLSGASFRTAAAAQPAAVPLTSSTGTVGSFDTAAATRTWLETVPTEKRAKADAYFEGGYWLILWNFLLGAAISLFLLGSGLQARERECLRAFWNSAYLAERTLPDIRMVMAWGIMCSTTGSNCFCILVFSSLPHSYFRALSLSGSCVVGVSVGEFAA